MAKVAMAKKAKATKAMNQKKAKIEKNERRRNKRIEKQLNSPKPPRSPNRFILYRKHIQNMINNDPNHPANMRDLSKVVAQMWEKESAEVKKHWDQVAEREKLNSPYRSSFDVINGLDMSISESGLTFVNATASSSKSATSKKKKNKNSNTSSGPIISDNFIIESPELNIPPSNPSNPNPKLPYSPLSPQYQPQSPQYLQYQQYPPTPQSPQSPQYQQSPQSPQLIPDEDLSFFPSPSPSISEQSYPDYFHQIDSELQQFEMQQLQQPLQYYDEFGPVLFELNVEPDWFTL